MTYFGQIFIMKLIMIKNFILDFHSAFLNLLNKYAPLSHDTFMNKKFKQVARVRSKLSNKYLKLKSEINRLLM